MASSNAFLAPALALSAALLLAPCASAQSPPSEQEIIDALLPASPGATGLTRGMSGDRGVSVSDAAEPSPPSIDLKVNFAFDSARLDNESLLTLDVLGRALSSEALAEQEIEIVGHTDAKGTVAYNDALSQRRATAVVAYLVEHFAVDGARLSSKGMGERELLDEAPAGRGDQPPRGNPKRDAEPLTPAASWEGK